MVIIIIIITIITLINIVCNCQKFMLEISFKYINSFQLYAFWNVLFWGRILCTALWNKQTFHINFWFLSKQNHQIIFFCKYSSGMEFILYSSLLRSFFESLMFSLHFQSEIHMYLSIKCGILWDVYLY